MNSTAIPPTPFISVCGVACERDVETIRDIVPLLPPGHVLAAGVLVSEKTLRGEAVESERYPSIYDVPGILRALKHAGAWPVVHFNTRAPTAELFDRLMVAPLGAVGFQLNVHPWPDPYLVRILSAYGPVILQWRGPHPEAAPGAALLDALRTAHQSGASFVLCDASAGTGKPLDPTLAIQYVNAWWDRSPELLGGTRPVGLALAGGLGPDAGDLLREVLAQCPVSALGSISFCAETRLRRPREGASRPGQDELAHDLAAAWVRVASRFIVGSL